MLTDYLQPTALNSRKGLLVGKNPQHGDGPGADAPEPETLRDNLLWFYQKICGEDRFKQERGIYCVQDINKKWEVN